MAVLLVVGCYHAAYETRCAVTCGAGGACPGSLVCNGENMCATSSSDTCLFDAGSGGLDSIPVPDAAPGCSTRLTTACVGTGNLIISTDIVTTTSPMCRTIQEPGTGRSLCLVAADAITVEGHIKVTGTLPLVLAANTIAITANADLDASSDTTAGRFGAGASITCTMNPAGPTNGGGGGGGTFGTMGGAGGNGNGMIDFGKATAVTPITRIVGGCPGVAGASSGAGTAGGVGGAGGGAMWLFGMQSISVASLANVEAGGGGGNSGSGGGGGGGGGGGSGGYLVFDTPILDWAGAGVGANGGGGGAGGLVGYPQAPPGDDGAVSSAARGEVGPGNSMSYGGDGGTGAYITFTIGGGAGSGSGPGAGGGGGGGGEGIIHVYAATVNGSPAFLSPMATP